jgi:4-hydroxybenzoate polyprenyltransferase
MGDFIDWLEEDAPEWAQVAACVALALTFGVVAILSIIGLVLGYWLPQLVIWIILPSALVVFEYIKSKKEKK